MNFNKFLPIICVFLFLISCKTGVKKEKKETKINSSINYAKGFDIQNFKTYIKLVVKSPYPDSNEHLEYILIDRETSSSQFVNDEKIIRIPLEKTVVTSTTHIPMLELLEVEQTLIGFPNTRYISSEATRKLVENGKIQELGNDGNINTEILIDLEPDAVIAFAMSGGNKSLSTIERAGIPLIYNGDWLEETPLGRAEWIKFFGILYGKEQMADSIFQNIENQYNTSKKNAVSTSNKPTVLSGALFKDVWNLPAGESFVAQFLKDANTDYLWKDTEGKGSLQLNFENVLDKGQFTDLWIAPGYFETKEQMLKSSKHYEQFEAFENNNVYTFANKKGLNGGVIYYELAPTRPDLVLKDIIKIAHPEVLKDYELTFFEKMN